MPIEKPILCIDDDRRGLALRKSLLEKNGYSVLATSSASRALKLFRTKPIRLVVADQLLKDEAGTELARKMKSIKPSVPIVLYSGTLPTSLKHIDCFILKTEPIPKFLSFIRDLLNRS